MVAKASRTDQARRLLLEQTAIAAGDAWARRNIANLRAERRAVVGGWPGTVREARRWATAFVMQSLVERGWGPADSGELERAARETYAHARGAWQASAGADIDRDGDTVEAT